MHINCYMDLFQLPGSFQWLFWHWVPAWGHALFLNQYQLSECIELWITLCIFCCIAEFTRCCAPAQAVRLRWKLEHSSGTATVKCKNKHNTNGTPPLGMSELWVFIHKVLLNTFYAAVCLLFLFSALPHSTAKHLHGLCFWKKRPT